MNLQIQFSDIGLRKNFQKIFNPSKIGGQNLGRFYFLYVLIKHKGRVVSRDSILDEGWGADVYVTPRTVDKHIAQLRKKIEDEPSNPKYIIGVRSIGYKFTQ